MPERGWLKDKLLGYSPEPEGLTAYECVYKHLFLNLLENSPRCLWRDNFKPGHITASAMVTNLECSKVLLMKHPKLGMWMQFGGHCDGAGDVYATALRELEEESGIVPTMVVSEGVIFDLDIQCIPARKDEPEHLHFDTRFLMRYDEKIPVPGSEENIEMRWFTLDEAEKMVTAGHGRWRMIQKIRSLQREIDHGRA